MSNYLSFDNLPDEILLKINRKVLKNLKKEKAITITETDWKLSISSNHERTYSKTIFETVEHNFEERNRREIEFFTSNIEKLKKRIKSKKS